MNYRNKLIIYSLTIITISQILLVFISIKRTGTILDQIRNENGKTLISNLNANFRTAFNDLGMLFDFLAANEIIEYTNSYINLLPADQQIDETQKVSARIDNLNVSSEIAESFIVLGRNIHQRGIYKRFGKPLLIDKPILTMEELESTGFISESFKDEGPFQFFPKGNVPDRLEKIRDSLDRGAYSRLSNFFSSMDGHLVYYQLIGSNLAVLVLQEDFCPRICGTMIPDEERVELRSSDETLIWSSARNDNEEPEYTKNQSVTIEPYSLDLSYYKPRKIQNREITLLLYQLIVTAIFTILLSLLLSHFLSLPLTNPLINLTNTITKNLDLDKPSLLENRKINSQYKTISYRAKLSFYLGLSVLLPLCISGILSSYMSYKAVKYQLGRTEELSTRMIQTKLSAEVDYYEGLINRFAACETIETSIFRVFAISQRDKELIDAHLFRHPHSLANIEYIVILDKYGIAKYQSIFSERAPRFVSDPHNVRFSVDSKIVHEEFLPEEKSIFWVAGLEDIYKQPVVSLVKKIPDKSNPEIINGYIQIVFKPDTFGSILNPGYMDLIILDSKKRKVFSSMDSKTFTESVLDIMGDNDWKQKKSVNIGNIPLLVTKENLMGPDWDILVFRRMDDAFAKKQTDFYRYILHMGGCLYSVPYYYSSSQQTAYYPLLALIKDTQKVSSDRKGGLIKYKRKDEISDLVNAYNKMIEHIQKLIHDNIQSKVREQELITLKTQAELNMLQQQIDPHFLYNTLEAISGVLTKGNSDTGMDMIDALGHFFRYNTKIKDITVSLSDELYQIDNYIKLQQMRFRDKFDVKREIEEDAFNVEVLKLILQPLVENAINHGLYEYAEGGLITVQGIIRDDMLHISVEDNGVGMSSEDLKNIKLSFEDTGNSKAAGKKTTGIALTNVYKRLKYFYKGEAGFTIESRPMKGTKVSIEIPLRDQQKMGLKTEQVY